MLTNFKHKHQLAQSIDPWSILITDPSRKLWYLPKGNSGTFLSVLPNGTVGWATPVGGGSETLTTLTFSSPNLLYKDEAGTTNTISLASLIPPSMGSPWLKEITGTNDALVTDKIYHEEDIRVKGTYIADAKYDIPFQTYFNRWNKNSLTVADLPTFNFTGGEFPNPLPAQPKNYAYNFGTNLGPGGGLETSNIAAYGISFEDRFYIDGVPYNEFHHLAIDQNGVQRRPLTSVYAWDGSFIGTTNQLSRLNLSDKDNTKEVYSINTATEDWNYNGTGLRHIFNTQNYQPIWQKDDTNQVYPLIGYLTGRLQFGNPTGTTIGRIGHSFEFGNGSGVDYIGTALGDGATNLHLGIAGKKYNTVFINGQFELPLRLTVPSNLNGWGHGITGSGYYFYDYNTSKTVLELRSDQIINNSPINLGTTYPTTGAGVPNGSMFKGTDGALYYKGGSGTVTQIAPN